MKNNFIKLLLVAVCGGIYTGCSEKEPYGGGNYTEQERENIWIYSQMKRYYLWNEQMPEQDDTNLSLSSSSYFYSILYQREDPKRNGYYYSYIVPSTYSVSKADAPDAAETYVTDLGLNGRLLAINNSRTLFQVLYVIPGSPAFNAGIESGMLISKINGNNIVSASAVINATQANLTICDKNGTDIQTINLKMGTYKDSPIIYYNTYDGPKKIGYLVYNHFSYGENYTFLNELYGVFNKFKSENVTELILDLRFNPGGYVNIATSLASMIAPKSIVQNKNVFLLQEYNQSYSAELKKNNSEYNITRFNPDVLEYNLNLNSVHIITSGYTASASEIIIHALKPYVNVFQYGETTWGKNLGSIQISDGSGTYGSILQPIVTRVYDKNNISGYEYGIIPDIITEDYYMSTLPLGYLEYNDEEKVYEAEYLLWLAYMNICSSQTSSYSILTRSLEKNYVGELILKDRGGILLEP